MKSRAAFACAALLGAGVLAWVMLQAPGAAEAPAPSRAEVTPAGAAPLRKPGSSASWLGRPAVPAPRAAQAAPPSLEMEYLRSRNYKALYDRISSSAEAQTPAGKYVLFEILRACASIADRGRRFVGKTPEARRNEFYAALPAGDPQRDKRSKAFEDVSVDRCAGLSAVSLTQADLERLLTDAANGGDPGARASVLEQQLAQARRGRWNSATLTDDQVESLKQVIGSRDPAAMLIAGRLLSNSYNDITLRVGPDAQAAEPRAMYNAWQILACDYGYPCGADNARVQSGCAFQGHCDAASLPDYLYYYASSPYDSQLLAQYRVILGRAIETGDWSQLAVVRGPRAPVGPGLGQSPFGPS